MGVRLQRLQFACTGMPFIRMPFPLSVKQSSRYKQGQSPVQVNKVCSGTLQSSIEQAPSASSQYVYSTVSV